jgi:hypothetical protein
MQTNRTCYCCGKDYYYCPTCEDQKDLETWHIMFHDENCKDIFHTCREDFLKHITREKSIENLKKCNLDYVLSLSIDISSQIKEILYSENQISKDKIDNKNKYKK